MPAYLRKLPRAGVAAAALAAAAAAALAVRMSVRHIAADSRAGQPGPGPAARARPGCLPSRPGCLPSRRAGGKGITLLVPFKSDGERRTETWAWLLEYWRHWLPDAQILMGRDDHTPFCVDTETKILTAAGWKAYEAVTVGDEVLTLNHATGLSEWQQVEAMNVFQVTDEPMLSSEGQAHSSLTTMNHRWPVVRRSGRGIRRGKRGGRGWTTSAELTGEDRVPLSAFSADLPSVPKYDDSLVEVAAWFWTEGTIIGRPVVISQSWAVNPAKCDRIYAALTGAFGPPAEAFTQGRGGYSAPDVPRWRVEQEHGGTTRFRLNAEAGTIVQGLAPGRVPGFDFIRSLTRAQLDLFIEASLLGDGSGQMLAQKDPRAAEAFQFACILAGQATSLRPNSLGKAGRAKYGYDMTNVYMRTAKTVSILAQQDVRPVSYSGTVWCPTTPNGTWLAQRRGTTWFTGNCKTAAVNDAFARSTGDIIVILDADCYIDAAVILGCAAQIRAARRLGRRMWFIPYRHFYRLTEDASRRVLDSRPQDPLRFTSPPPPGDTEESSGQSVGHWFGALISIMPRAAFEAAVGMDIRFSGWGGEDISFMNAVDTLYCKHHTTRNQTLHLWHPHIGTLHTEREWAGQSSPGANNALAVRYQGAYGRPDRMRALTREDGAGTL